MNAATEIRTIGVDNGIGDAFFADVAYADGSAGRIVVYGEHMQGAARLLRMFAEIENFTIANIR
jgi:hypothetical protein